MIGIRWTIGDVAVRGFQALGLSLWGAWRLFGRAARYRVYVNSLELDRARALTGAVPAGVEWRTAVREQLPDWLASRVDGGFAEGVAWKLIPLRAFPERYELALDNDVILWSRPRALDAWLQSAGTFLLAEDVRRCFGAFGGVCPPLALNSGIRGLPPDFDFEAALRSLLEQNPVRLARELDEQGMQVAALYRAGPVRRVAREEVTICSPFPPHVPELGRAGAHFVGLNSRRLGFRYYGRPAELVRAEHWDGCVGELARRVGAPFAERISAPP